MKTDIAFGFAFGVSCAIVGYPFYTWQFWLLVVIATTWRFSPEFKDKQP